MDVEHGRGVGFESLPCTDSRLPTKLKSAGTGQVHLAEEFYSSIRVLASSIIAAFPCVTAEAVPPAAYHLPARPTSAIASASICGLNPSSRCTIFHLPRIRKPQDGSRSRVPEPFEKEGYAIVPVFGRL
jgi:hypothetical protein